MVTCNLTRSTHRTSEAKLNNFTRLQLTFKLLSVPFSVNLVSHRTTHSTMHCSVSVVHFFVVSQARDVMTGKAGAAVQLMYQMYMALNRKIVSTSSPFHCCLNFCVTVCVRRSES